MLTGSAPNDSFRVPNVGHEQALTRGVVHDQRGRAAALHRICVCAGDQALVERGECCGDALLALVTREVFAKHFNHAGLCRIGDHLAFMAVPVEEGEQAHVVLERLHQHRILVLLLVCTEPRVRLLVSIPAIVTCVRAYLPDAASLGWGN